MTKPELSEDDLFRITHCNTFQKSFYWKEQPVDVFYMENSHLVKIQTTLLENIVMLFEHNLSLVDKQLKILFIAQ